MSEYVRTVGAGKTHETLKEFFDVEATAVAAGDQLVAEIYGDVSDPVIINPVGWTFADEAATIIVRPAVGQGHGGVFGAGACLKLSNNNPGGIILYTVNDMHILFEDLEVGVIGDAAAANNGRIVPDGQNTADHRVFVNRCLFEGNGGFPASPAIAADNMASGGIAVVKVTNSIARGFGYGVCSGKSSDPDGVVVQNCLSVGGGIVGFAYVLATNCWGIGTFSVDCFVGESASCDHNIASDASAIGANSLNSKTDYASYFVDHLNGDYRLKGTTGDGGIFGASGIQGADLGITDDIRSYTRTLLDIGPFGSAAIAPSGGGGGRNIIGTGLGEIIGG